MSTANVWRRQLRIKCLFIILTRIDFFQHFQRSDSVSLYDGTAPHTGGQQSNALRL